MEKRGKSALGNVHKTNKILGFFFFNLCKLLKLLDYSVFQSSDVGGKAADLFRSEHRAIREKKSSSF